MEERIHSKQIKKSKGDCSKRKKRRQKEDEMEEKCREKENGKRNENVVSSPILYHTIEVSLYKASMSRSNLILVSSFSLYLACVRYIVIYVCVYVRYV